MDRERQVLQRAVAVAAAGHVRVPVRVGVDRRLLAVPEFPDAGEDLVEVAVVLEDPLDEAVKLVVVVRLPRMLLGVQDWSGHEAECGDHRERKGCAAPESRAGCARSVHGPAATLL